MPGRRASIGPSSGKGDLDKVPDPVSPNARVQRRGSMPELVATPSDEKQRQHSIKALVKATKAGNLKECKRALDALTGGKALGEVDDLGLLAMADEALAVACCQNDVDIVHWLVNLGADPTAQVVGDAAGSGGEPMSSLHFAAARGSTDVVCWLVDKRGFSALEPTAKTGSTLLHVAARGTRSRHAAVVQWLVESGGVGVNVARRTDGATALHIAALSGSDRVCKVLLALGADASLVARNLRHDDQLHTSLELSVLEAGSKGKAGIVLSKLHASAGANHAACAVLLRAAVTAADDVTADVDGTSDRATSTGSSAPSTDSGDRLSGTHDFGSPASEDEDAAVPALNAPQPTECARCSASDVELRTCSACLLVGYCGRECQVAHWADHKATCAAHQRAQKERRATARDVDLAKRERRASDEAMRASEELKQAQARAKAAKRREKAAKLEAQGRAAEKDGHQGTRKGLVSKLGSKLLRRSVGDRPESSSSHPGSDSSGGPPPQLSPPRPEADVLHRAGVSEHAGEDLEARPRLRVNQPRDGKGGRVRTSSLSDVLSLKPWRAGAKKSTVISPAAPAASTSPTPPPPAPAESPGADEDVQDRDLGVCHACKKECDVQMCMRCLKVHYCSRHCQKLDWPRHKAVCVPVDGAVHAV